MWINLIDNRRIKLGHLWELEEISDKNREVNWKIFIIKQTSEGVYILKVRKELGF